MFSIMNGGDMFEATKVGRSLAKEDFKDQQEDMRTQLLAVQRELRQTDIPLIVIISGVEAVSRNNLQRVGRSF